MQMSFSFFIFTLFSWVCSSLTHLPIQWDVLYYPPAFIWFLFFLTPLSSVGIMLIDQCWDLLYSLHISSAMPFSPPPHLFSAFFFVLFLTSATPVMLLLCLYSLFISSLHRTKLLIWLTPEQRSERFTRTQIEAFKTWRVCRIYAWVGTVCAWHGQSYMWIYSSEN